MQNRYELDYIKLVNRVLVTGAHKQSRVGPTRSVFGETLTIDSLEEDLFPVLTTRKMFVKPVFAELAAFLKGATLLEEFKKFGCNYWDANAAAWPPNAGVPPEAMSVGRIYGAQWREWSAYPEASVDQIARLVQGIDRNPSSRRHLLTTFNPAEINAGCLPPCHLLSQFNVRGSCVDLIVYMRSVDLCLGLPSDVVLYAALLILVCKATHYRPGKITFMLGDTHVYDNHRDAWDVQRQRVPLPLPPFALNSSATIEDFLASDIQLLDYQHGERLDYPLNA